VKKIVLLIVCSIFIISNLSCITLKQPKTYRELTGQQKTQAEEWLHSGNLLYEVEDYELALDYYRKIVKYYPGTKYTEEAKSKIEKINKMRFLKESKNTEISN